MEITASLNGVKVKKTFPIRWKEMPFGTFVELYETQDDIRQLSILTQIEYETLRKSEISNLDEVLQKLNFLKTPLAYDVPREILGYPIPKDLAFTQAGRYEDVKLICESFDKEGNVSKTDLLKYTEICGIYAQPNYMEASQEEQKEFAKQFLNAPCEEVMAVGNFTFLKLTGLKLNMLNGYRTQNTLMKKWRLAFRAWRSRLAFSIRYAGWKRKLRSQGLNF